MVIRALFWFSSKRSKKIWIFLTENEHLFSSKICLYKQRFTVEKSIIASTSLYLVSFTSILYSVFQFLLRFLVFLLMSRLIGSLLKLWLLFAFWIGWSTTLDLYSFIQADASLWIFLSPGYPSHEKKNWCFWLTLYLIEKKEIVGKGKREEIKKE